MNYIELELQVKTENFVEILEAELADIDFESFISEGDVLKAYIETEKFDSSALKCLLDEYAEEIIKAEHSEIEHQNWNSVWEANYAPVKLDDELFIGATFHETDLECRYSILLEPNMSFGTGHHPTTEMMLRAMFEIDFSNKFVLDFGCGSAILSIYASYKGAHGFGVEIDRYAAEAARENLVRNEVQNFTIITGDIDSFSKQSFDVILANINKNVIEECLPIFRSCAKPGTKFLCSGFLEHDVQNLSQSIEASGFSIKSVLNIGEWAMINSIYKG